MLPGGLFISSPFEWGGGGLYRDGSLFERGGLFNLEQTMVSVVHKEVEYKVEKLKYKEVRGYAASQTNPNFQELINIPSRISPHEVLRL